MYTSPDEARSDVILAGAAAVLGAFLLRVLEPLPGYPRAGLLGGLVALVWLFALTGLVPLLLARYRGDGAAAFGLDGPRDALGRGLVLVIPVVAIGVLDAFVTTGDPIAAVLGRVGVAALAPPGGVDPVTVALEAVRLVVLVVGALLLTTFLTVRGREGFRPVEVPLTQTLRTVGMGAVGVALFMGGLRSLGPDVGFVAVLLQVVALAALVLLADRLVPLGPTVPRGAVLAPVVLVAVAHLFIVGGGLLFGNPIVGLHAAALATGTTVVIATLVSTRRLAWAIMPLLIALHWWPSCLSPVALERAAGC